MVPCRTHPDNDNNMGCDGEHSAANSSDGVGTTHLIPVIDKMWDSFMDGFTRLYMDSLLCSRLEIILVDLEQPESVVHLTLAESSNDLWSWSPLMMDGCKWVLASQSTLTVLNELVLGRFEEHSGWPRVTWQVIEMPPLSCRVESALHELRALVLAIPK
ncbi:hypothetical protein EDB89DRAFT_2153045 [Lactarius sanguifluus]|nr:hypothetical protein EDB89DRAFT_2153045 [Lactarius sanguifluus]